MKKLSALWAYFKAKRSINWNALHDKAMLRNAAIEANASPISKEELRALQQRLDKWLADNPTSGFIYYGSCDKCLENKSEIACLHAQADKIISESYPASRQTKHFNEVVE